MAIDYSPIERIIRAVAENPISSTDSSCAFCQAYGDDPHTIMSLEGEEIECPVLIAQEIIRQGKAGGINKPSTPLF